MKSLGSGERGGYLQNGQWAIMIKEQRFKKEKQDQASALRFSIRLSVFQELLSRYCVPGAMF